MIRRWLKRRRCFHHEPGTGVSRVKWQLIDVGRRKLYECELCGKVWIF